MSSKKGVPPFSSLLKGTAAPKSMEPPPLDTPAVAAFLGAPPAQSEHAAIPASPDAPEARSADQIQFRRPDSMPSREVYKTVTCKLTRGRYMGLKTLSLAINVPLQDIFEQMIDSYLAQAASGPDLHRALHEGVLRHTN